MEREGSAALGRAEGTRKNQECTEEERFGAQKRKGSDVAGGMGCEEGQEAGLRSPRGGWSMRR